MERMEEPEIASLASPKEEDELRILLESFAVRHASQFRPIALVTSGGTTAPLEVNEVRFLDNFSTGTRGAISAEQFLSKGYAVIYLSRTGCAMPYVRRLHQLLQVNKGWTWQSLSRLFQLHNTHHHHHHDEETTSKEDQDDPWTEHDDTRNDDDMDEHISSSSSRRYYHSRTGRQDVLRLNDRLAKSTKLKECLEAYSKVQGSFLHVEFTSVDEYLAKLKLCCKVLEQTSGSMTLLYLAAAVSDFYIPSHKKPTHKIQSRNYNPSSSNDNNHCCSDGILRLELYPVPKCLGAVRQLWAPSAFCVSFKLETDATILQHKAQYAMNKYGVHMVIGNILATRYSKVYVLHHHSQTFQKLTEISNNNDDNSHDLEENLISHVMEQHFDYISTFTGNNQQQQQQQPSQRHNDALQIMVQHHKYLEQKKVQIRNQYLWKRFYETSLQVLGHGLGMFLTYSLTQSFQRRFSSSSHR